jgi:beta-glucosidase
MEQSQLTDLLGQMTLDEKIGQLLQITEIFTQTRPKSVPAR